MILTLSHYYFHLFHISIIILRVKTQNPEFCAFNELKSVFNTDKDIYFVNKQNSYWKFNIETKGAVIDNNFANLVKRIGFSDNSPVLGFKFSPVYECSKDMTKCRNSNYNFDGIEYCVNDTNYCKNLVKFQDMIILFGFHSNGSQFYQSVKHKQNDFEVLNDTNLMPRSWPPKGLIVNKGFIFPDKDITGNSLVGTVYRRHEFELVLILKSGQNIIVKYSFTKNKSWFQRLNQWLTIDPDSIQNENIIGLFELNQNVYALIDNDSHDLYIYEHYGNFHAKTRFRATNETLFGLFNCNGFHSPNLTSNQPSIDLSVNPWTQPSNTSSSPESSIRNESNIWQYIVIPIIIICLALFICAVFYFWFKSKSEISKHESNSEQIRKNLKPKDISNAMTKPHPKI